MRFKPGRCCGEFCNADIRYPGSMQDIETQNDPWMRTARYLCAKTSSSGVFLLNSEELVACLPYQQQSPSLPSSPPKGTRKRSAFMAAGRICASLIQEAQRYPKLCVWMRDELGWMLDPWDAALLEVAAGKIGEDEAAAAWVPVPRKRRDPPPSESGLGGTPALWMRVQTVPVCRTCLCIYAVLHGVITMITGQRRDLWAKRTLLRRQQEDEQRRRQTKTELLEALAHRTQTRSLSPRTHAAHCAKLCRPSSSRPRRSSVCVEEPAVAWHQDAEGPSLAPSRPKSAEKRTSTQLRADPKGVASRVMAF